MGYNKHVTGGAAVIPSANVESARLRLEEFGFKGTTLVAALAEARWFVEVNEKSGDHVVEWYDGDRPGEDEEEALQGLGDLCAPDGVLYWIGEDDEQWAWRFNYKGHPFVEVNLQLVPHDVRPAPGFPTTAATTAQAYALQRVGLALDEAVEELRKYMDDPAKNLGSLLLVLEEAHSDLLDAARPELAAEWRSLAARVKHVEEEGLEDVDYELLRDAREKTMMVILDEVTATPSVVPIVEAPESTDSLHAGLFAIEVLRICDREGRWEPPLTERVSREASDYFKRHPVYWLNTDNDGLIDGKLHDAALDFVQSYSRSEYVLAEFVGADQYDLLAEQDAIRCERWANDPLLSDAPAPSTAHEL